MQRRPILPWEIAPQLLQFPRCRASARARCREGATPRRRQHDCTRHLGLLLCGYRGCWRCWPADHAAWRAPPLRTCLGPSEIDLEWLKRWCTWRTRGARSARGSDLVGPALLDALRLRRVPADSDSATRATACTRCGGRGPGRTEVKVRAFGEAV